MIHATWSDGQRFEIYRRYGDFFSFDNRLLLLFPTEAGKYKSTDRILPTLPSKCSVCLSLLRTSVSCSTQLLRKALISETSVLNVSIY